eukprot:1330401-Prorocentrum_lima.AAC.1
MGSPQTGVIPDQRDPVAHADPWQHHGARKGRPGIEDYCSRYKVTPEGKDQNGPWNESGVWK